MARIIIVLALIAVMPGTAAAQESNISLGGSVHLTRQTHSDDPPLGGTTAGGAGLFGVRVSRDLAIEFEPSFGGAYSWEYMYRPFPSAVATVVVSRRDLYLPVQARFRMGIVEPVLGVSVVRGSITRHATIGAAPYWKERWLPATRAMIERFRQTARNSRVVVMEGASHYLFRDREDEVVREMTTFYDSLPR